MSNFTPTLQGNLKLFKARVAKFNKMEAIQKELCLLIGVKELDPQTNSEIPFRDHLWVDVTPTKKGNQTKIVKSHQGDFILFYGKVYEYTNSALIKQEGIELKFPQCYKYIKG